MSLAEADITKQIITRSQARSLGLKRYFSGIPCVHGHLYDRITVNGTCIICSYAKVSAIGKRDRVKNREKHRNRRRKYLLKLRNLNPIKYEEILKKKRDWSEKNRLHISRYDKNKREKYPEIMKKRKIIYAAKRRAKKTKAGGYFTQKQIDLLFDKQVKNCANCFIYIGDGYEIDHIIPISRGGSSWIKNIQLLCPPCNHRKNSKDPIKFAQENGRLL